MKLIVQTAERGDAIGAESAGLLDSIAGGTGAASSSATTTYSA